MTKGDVVKLLGIEEEVFDYALPQPWVDDVVEAVGCGYHEVTGQFVWLYGGDYRFGGRPFALTTRANEILTDINSKTNSNWPLTEKPINLAEHEESNDY